MNIEILKEALPELLEIQSKLDKEYNLKFRGDENKNPEYAQIMLALNDELGEINHAAKGWWCYWKESQKEVDLDELLEEVADAIHFCLSAMNYTKARYISHNKAESVRETVVDEIIELNAGKISLGAQRLLALNRSILKYPEPSCILAYLFMFAGDIGFTEQDVIDAYKAKNEKNYARMRSGY